MVEIEERMKREEEEREQRQRKAKRLQQSYDILRLCREVMEKEGIHWEKSRERREHERGKVERKHIAEIKKKAVNEKMAREKLQMRITENLKKTTREYTKITENGRGKRNEDNSAGGQEGMWKRWRQKKGRGPLTLTKQASKAEKGC